MKRNFFKRIGGALAAAVAVAGLLFGCSDIAGTGDEGGSAATGELRNVTVRIPDYAKLSEQAVSGSRAIAPQTASVRLSSTAETAVFTAITKSLSDGEGTYEDGDTGKVAATSYKFSFRIPVGTYAAGSLKVELLDSSDNVLTAGTNTAEIALTAAGANGNFAVVPNIEESTDNLSGSLAAGEMKFVEVTLDAGASYTVTVSGDVSLYVFSSDGALMNTTAIPAPFTGSTIENSKDAAVTYYIGIYSASAVESYSVSVSEVVTSVDVTWDFSATTKPTMSKSAEFTAPTDTLQSATGYVKGTSDTIFLYVDASSGKLSTNERTSDAQFNSGTKIQIPVSAESVVTADVYSTAYELGGVAVTAAKTTYTATKAGYVVLKSTGSNYLNSIAVTGLNVGDDFTADVVSFEAGTAEITNGTGTLGLTATSGNVTSSDTDVLIVESVTTDKITVKAGTKAGNVTVTAGDGTNSATIAVTVGDYGAVTVGTIEPYSASTVLSSVEWDMDGTNSLAFYSDAACTTALTSTTLQSTSGTGYVVGTSSKAPLYVDATSGKFAYTSGSYVQVNANTKIYVPVSANSEVTVTMHSNASAYKFVTVGSNSVAMTADSDTFTAAADGYLLVALSSDASGAYMLGITATNVDTSTERTAGTTVAVSVPAVESITVKTAPTTTSYEKDAEIDLTGLVITASYSDSTSADITYSSTSGITASGFDSSAVGSNITKTITVTYEEKTATFDYTYAVTEATTPDTWSWKASDVTTTTLGVESLSDKGDADNLTLLASCLSTTGNGNIYRVSSGAVASIELVKLKGGAAVIVIGTTADLKLAIGSTGNSSTTSAIGLYSDSGYSTLVAPTSTTGTLDSSSLVSVTGGTGSATVTYRSIAAGTYYFVTGESSRAVRLSQVDVTTPATVSSTKYTYSAPTVTLSASTASLNTDVTATAEIPNATITTTWSDSSEDVAEKEVSATITWSATDSEGNAANIIDSNGKITTTTAGTFSIYASYTIDGTEYKSDAATLTLKDVTLYTVTFDTNGGTSVDSQSIESGAAATKPETDPTKAGYTFGGWYTSTDEGTTLSDTAYDFSTAVTADITLYAKWALVYVAAGTYNLTTKTISVDETSVASVFTSQSDGASQTANGITVTSKIDSSGANIKPTGGNITFAISQAMTLTFVDSNKKGAVISTSDGYVGKSGTTTSETLGADGTVTTVTLGAGSYKIVGASSKGSSKITYLIFAEVTE